AVARLRAAGAVLVGALNMDEYAYGFSTENTHYGPTRNPRDPSRIAGGSSGGSAAAVAGGLVPLTLGTDTHGSIPAPAALCALFAAAEALAAVTRVAAALGARREVSLPEAHRARAAAQVITACEGSAYHLENLRARAADFDPMIRDRLLAAALLPAAAYLRAQRFRAWYRARVAEVFREVDVLLAPTTPWTAPAIGAPWTTRIDGTEVPTRGHLGVFTQP